MCGHFLPVRASVLPAQRIGREDFTLHQHSAVVDRVLPAAGRNYSADITHCAAARQVSALHDDARNVISSGYDCGAQC